MIRYESSEQGPTRSAQKVKIRRDWMMTLSFTPVRDVRSQKKITILPTTGAVRAVRDDDITL